MLRSPSYPLGISNLFHLLGAEGAQPNAPLQRPVFILLSPLSCIYFLERSVWITHSYSPFLPYIWTLDPYYAKCGVSTSSSLEACEKCRGSALPQSYQTRIFLLPRP